MFISDKIIELQDQDRLRFKPLIDALLATINHRDLVKDSAFTIGILGTWGVGKSSLINLLMTNLNAFHDKFVTVIFNAWRFDNEGRLFAPFILTLASVAPRHTDILKKAIKIASNTMAGVVKIAVSKHAGISFNLRNLFRIDEESGIKKSELECYIDDIKNLVLEITEGGRKILVAFIDDLDRCTPPEKGLELLEDLKLLLDLPDIFFIISIDPDSLEKTIKSQYGDEPHIARRYLEKFIQLPIYLPPHQTSRIASLVEESTNTNYQINIPEIPKNKIVCPIPNFQALIESISHLNETTAQCFDNFFKSFNFTSLLRLLGKTKASIKEEENKTSGQRNMLFRKLNYVTDLLCRYLEPGIPETSENLISSINELIRDWKKYKKQLIKRGLSENEFEEILNYFNSIKKELREPSTTTSINVKELTEEVNKFIKENQSRGELERILKRVARAFENNPRRFKRFWNLFIFELFVFASKGNLRDINLELLAKWISCFLIFPEFMNIYRISEIFDFEREAEKRNFEGFISWVRWKLASWSANFTNEEVQEISGIFTTFKNRFSGLDEVMLYAFPHEERFDLLAQVIERNTLAGHKYKEWKFEREVDLSNRFLENGYFEGWEFKGGANFSSANLRYANFKDISVGYNSEIVFFETKLENADFTNAKLNPRVSFKKAELKNAKFIGTVFSEVDFEDADLEGAEFIDITVTPGRCLELHKAKNWDKINVFDEKILKLILENHENCSPKSDEEKARLQKFTEFLRSRLNEIQS